MYTLNYTPANGLSVIGRKEFPSIFLAGPMQRFKEGEDIGKSWHDEMIQVIHSNLQGTQVVYSPHMKSKPIDWTYDNQVNWELTAMDDANVIIFWIPRSDSMPGLTTNIEFGKYMRSGKIVVGTPEGSTHNDYIRFMCKKYGIPCYQTMREVVDMAGKMLERLFVSQTTPRIFFTSDTHFSSQRTLEFSRRPFNNIEQMDSEIICRWNEVVSSHDTVYHLGDFGNPELVRQLNGEKIYLLLGNYENEDPNAVKALLDDPRVNILPELSVVHDYLLIHEPIKIGKDSSIIHSCSKETIRMAFYLFGHVHSLSKVKFNGLNVGTDCHNFYPIDLETVNWYRNAIENHYDFNVFSRRCRLNIAD